MGGQRGGIEGRDAAPATGHALLPQEGVGLIPQAAKGGAAALRRHHVDVEVPGGLAGRRGLVAAAHLILPVRRQAEPQAADDPLILEGAEADGALARQSSGKGTGVTVRVDTGGSRY